MSEIIMPKMGDAMTEGKVVRWYKKAGDAVKRGEPVLEIETDKVNLDLEAESDGTLGELAAQEGETVQVGGLLARVLGAGEKEEPKAEKPAPAEQPKAEAKAEAKAEPKDEPGEGGDPQRRGTDKKDSIKHTTGEYHEAIEQKGPRRDRTSQTEPAPAAASSGEGGRRKSSPLARRMAKELGVSLDSVQGSGPQGRIVAADVKSASTQPREAATAQPRAAGAPVATLGPAPELEAKSIPLS
ncbi:MAG TPA: biotin/lipoyl-containing protein, partial [Thermoanaerobaculia bacterium]